MEPSKPLILLSTMVAFICINYIPTQAKENEGFSYNLHAWNGPPHWGDINKEWKMCKIGCMQSPISIDDKKVIFVNQSEELQWTYRPKDAVLKNLGHNIVIEWEDAVGAVWINNIEYQLKQFHWHTPSEHIINDRQFDLEVHLLHQHVNDQRMAMVSILYTIGDPDPFFAKIESHIGTISRKLNATQNLGVVDPNDIKRVIERYYRLKGSITIPPCTEGVTWTINRKIRTISLKQLNVLKYAAMPEYERNARPVQQLNDRVVKLYG